MTRVSAGSTPRPASAATCCSARCSAPVSPLEVVRDAVTRSAPEPVRLEVETVTRNGFAATRCHVRVSDSSTERTLGRHPRLLVAAPWTRRSASSRGSVRTAGRGRGDRARHPPSSDVHFHEVGALDSIADVVGAAAGFVPPRAGAAGVLAGGVGRWVPCRSRTARSACRLLPSSSCCAASRRTAGRSTVELTTPTGAALLRRVVDDFGPAAADGGRARSGPEPAGATRRVTRTCCGCCVGGAVATRRRPAGALVIEANVDDLDPRLWPDVIAALLAAGASDAWLTPILMKKGRPAHTLHVLVAADAAAIVRREIFRQTSTIGVREQTFGKHALDREFVEVEVDGHTVAVKLARLDGELMNVQPEYERRRRHRRGDRPGREGRARRGSRPRARGDLVGWPGESDRRRADLRCDLRRRAPGQDLHRHPGAVHPLPRAPRLDRRRTGVPGPDPIAVTVGKAVTFLPDDRCTAWPG